jgi:nicotinate-nucleotide adenylyltransferase
MTPLRIGLLGGTFDPIHYGHLAMAETAIRRFRLQTVFFVTAVNPPHKCHMTHANFLDRHAMVALALVRKPKMVPSSLEYGHSGKSYSIDTVRQLKREVGDRAEIFFLIGMDAFLELPTWKDYRLLIDYCSFVVYPRPGSEGHSVEDRLPRSLLERVFQVPKGASVAVHPGHRIYLIKDFSSLVSSTEVRGRVHQEGSLQRVVPKAVSEYIGKTKLYLS